MNHSKHCLQEKTRAAAAPRKPKKGAVSSPLKVEDIFSDRFGFLQRSDLERKLLFSSLEIPQSERERERSFF